MFPQQPQAVARLGSRQRGRRPKKKENTNVINTSTSNRND